MLPTLVAAFFLQYCFCSNFLNIFSSCQPEEKKTLQLPGILRCILKEPSLPSSSPKGIPLITSAFKQKYYVGNTFEQWYIINQNHRRYILFVVNGICKWLLCSLCIFSPCAKSLHLRLQLGHCYPPQYHSMCSSYWSNSWGPRRSQKKQFGAHDGFTSTGTPRGERSCVVETTACAEEPEKRKLVVARIDGQEEAAGFSQNKQTNEWWAQEIVGYIRQYVFVTSQRSYRRLHQAACCRDATLSHPRIDHYTWWMVISGVKWLKNADLVLLQHSVVCFF